MKHVPLVPVNFRLAARAANEIRRLTSYLQVEDGKEYVPSLFWDESYDEVQKRLIENGFVLGWYERSEVHELLQKINDIEIVFAVTEGQAENFEGKTIDFIDGNFRFAEGQAPSTE